MKTEIKDLPRGQAEITVELNEIEFKPFLEQAAKIISENKTIKGFRRGKATYDLIKKHVGEHEIWQTAVEPAIRKTLVQVLEEKQLITVGQPEISVEKLAPGNSVIYKAKVSFLPKVQLPDYKSIKVAGKKTEVGETEINKSLDNLRKMYSNQKPVERAAKTNDKVSINFETFLDKVPVDHGAQKEFYLVLGEGNFIPGFEEKVVGMSKGEEKSFELKFPKEYHQKNLAGKLVDFKVKVNEVNEVILPQVTDEFAQGLGQFKTAEELKNQIKKDLSAEAEKKDRIAVEDDIMLKLIDQSKFDDIPDVLVNTEARKMFEELQRNVSHQGMKFEDYLSHLKKSPDDLLLDFMPQALTRVKSALIIREVAKQTNMTVNEADIDEELKRVLVMYGGNAAAEKELNAPSYRNYLRNSLAAKKALEHLKAEMVQ